MSNNNQLSGYVPKFPNGSSLETLNLLETSFSGVTMSNFGNLISLAELGLDGRSITMEPLYLFANKLDSIDNLQLSLTDFSGEVGAFFSWIRHLKSLTSLKLFDCYSSKIMPSWIGNLTHLESLDIRYCGFTGPIPSSIGNLTRLESLTISDCAFSGQLPSSIGNLKNLKFLQISYNNGLSGPITPTIGDLHNLAVIILRACRVSGRIPNVISNMTKLIFVDLSQNDLIGKI